MNENVITEKWVKVWYEIDSKTKNDEHDKRTYRKITNKAMNEEDDTKSLMDKVCMKRKNDSIEIEYKKQEKRHDKRAIIFYI